LGGGLSECWWQSSAAGLGEQPDELCSFGTPAALHLQCHSAGLLLNFLVPYLENEQPGDQFGFRRGLGIDDAMMVLERVCGKSVAWVVCRP